MMDLLRDLYDSSSEEDQPAKKHPGSLFLGEVPSELRNMFINNEYDVGTERRRAQERAGDTRWIRRFPHERGNWPAYIFLPVPNSNLFVTMAKASIADFRRRLAKAWADRHGSEGAKDSRKRVRNGKRKRKRKRKGGAEFSDREQTPPEIITNDLGSSGEQHLSLSKTIALRAHEIEPFVEGLKKSVEASRSFTASIVADYDVLVNEDKTRSFVCLRVRGGRQLVLTLISKVDPLMRRFKQPEYYKDPVIHVSVASVPGDISSYVGSAAGGIGSTPLAPVGRGVERHGDNEEVERGREGKLDVEDAPPEVFVSVEAIVCKAGTTRFEAPLVPGP